MRIYVASSWRNEFQPAVVQALREDGHEVYDFKDAEGFHWEEVDEEWQKWPENIQNYLLGLMHPCAERGFRRDMKALYECDACVYVAPCGVSASLEAGWACGAGKLVIAYIPQLREAELMIKMVHCVTTDLHIVRDALREEVSRLKEQKAALIEACEEIMGSDEFINDGRCSDCEDHFEPCDCEYAKLRCAVAKAKGEATP